MSEFEVGQTLYVAYRERYRGTGLTPKPITAIGRKWITVGTGGGSERFDRTDPGMVLDGHGYSSPGRAYLTEDEYHGKVALDAAWGKVQTFVRAHYSPPGGMTLERVTAAAQALGIDL